MFLHTKHSIIWGVCIKVKLHHIIILYFHSTHLIPQVTKYVSNYQRMSVYTKYSKLRGFQKCMLQINGWLHSDISCIVYYTNILILTTIFILIKIWIALHI